jgi:protein-L-isoaspartate(D-aspartate) O-methyltransferase
VAPSNVDSKGWGHVYAVEIVPALAVSARKNLEKTGYLNRVSIVNADGSRGYQEEAPYDRIFVTAAAPEVPKPLIDQLKPGGIMVIPVGGQYLYQELLLVEKTVAGEVVAKSICGVAFVLLRGQYGWK